MTVIILFNSTIEFNATLFNNSIDVDKNKLIMAESKQLVSSNKLALTEQNITSFQSATSLSATTTGKQ